MFGGEICGLYQLILQKLTNSDISNENLVEILSKSGIKTVIQAKRSARNVGNKAVQEVIGARHYYKADYAMVVTNSSFTKNAIALAESSDVKLVDREELIVFSYRINQY